MGFNSPTPYLSLTTLQQIGGLRNGPLHICCEQEYNVVKRHKTKHIMYVPNASLLLTSRQSSHTREP